MKKALLVLGLVTSLAFSQEEEIIVKTPLTKKLSDMNVSIGVISIGELKTNFPRSYQLLVKHHGEPTKYDTHHLAVSLWKKEGENIVYISDYKVEAEVRSPLLRSSLKPLNKYKHQHGDNYGNWFQMLDKGLYSINIHIEDKSGKKKLINFDYLNQ